MRYCDRCRNEIPDDGLYCSKCGAYVGLKYCPRCNALLNASAHFCPKCGLKQDNSGFNNNNSENGACSAKCEAPKKKYKKHVIPLLVWSLILVVLINPLGTVLGAISSVYLLSANTVEDDEQRSLKIKKSLILCTTATVFDILSIIVLIVNLYL